MINLIKRCNFLKKSSLLTILRKVKCYKILSPFTKRIEFMTRAMIDFTNRLMDTLKRMKNNINILTLMLRGALPKIRNGP